MLVYKSNKCKSFFWKFVQFLKLYMNWVQIDENQIVFYLKLLKKFLSTKGKFILNILYIKLI